MSVEWKYSERAVSTLIRWLRSVVLPVVVAAAAAAALGGCGGSMAVGGLGMVDLAVCVVVWIWHWHRRCDVEEEELVKM